MQKRAGTNTTATNEINIETKKGELQLENGTYEMYAEVYDKAGNSKKSDTKQVTVLNHEAVYVGTAAIHTKCKNCNKTLSTSHTMTNVSSSSVCQQCICGYKITSHTPVNGGTASVHKKCSVCNYTIQGSSSHSYTNTTVASTCTVKGYTNHVCGCGYSYKDELALANHDYRYFRAETGGEVGDGTYHPKVANMHYISKCKNCGGGRYLHHYTSGYKCNTDSYAGTCPHYITCTHNGSYTCTYGNLNKNIYQNDGWDSKKYVSTKHSCSDCGATNLTSTTFNERCDKATSHKHTCSICGATGTNTDTGHNGKGRKVKTKNGTSTSNHIYKEYCTCEKLYKDTKHPLTVYSTDKWIYSCSICGFSFTKSK